ncbi:MAG: bifunctional diaminohydroxyphosphoribosylaminopyrimidine deaminase/5-amino-6-(5-phosphoribosylamino)uracil reductase RibD [Candidatus Aminicenantales bacterium]
MSNLKDTAYLNMAYGLAEKAKGRASPNPYVGAVVVANDRIAGCGYHEGPGKDHAEIIAFEKAGRLSKNSTLYVTLEPCVHWGRTPPCADRILQVRPKRIVVSALDPNPLVYRKGIKKIKDAGIEVSVGLLREKNNRLNEAYLKYITQKIPFLTLKAAISLDGKLATKKFDSRWISSAQSREYAHLLRGEYDALMVGINTVLYDDPMLTVRHAHWTGKTIRRIILDSHLRLPLTAKILATSSRGQITVFCKNDASPKKRNSLEKRWVEVVPLLNSSRRIDLKEVLSWLGKREISSVLVEGGEKLSTALLEESLVDKVYLVFSPKFIGGKDAVSLFAGEGAGYIQDSLRLKKIHSFPLDEDIIMEGYF